MIEDMLRLGKEDNTVTGKDAQRLAPQSGRIEPSGVYATPQRLLISRGSFTNVLGSLGFVCETGDEELGELLPVLLVEAWLEFL